MPWLKQSSAEVEHDSKSREKLDAKETKSEVESHCYFPRLRAGNGEDIPDIGAFVGAIASSAFLNRTKIARSSSPTVSKDSLTRRSNTSCSYSVIFTEK
jgi:hypothetical protein